MRIFARFVEALIVLAVLLGFEHVAMACTNATMSESTAIARLKEAEIALDQGDVLTARELSVEVMDPEQTDALLDRAARIRALSFVRDPRATKEELNDAVGILTIHATAPPRFAMGSDPPLLADYGEALERAGQNDQAYEVLAPLADRDLIGSAYAYAALARAARARDDRALSATAAERCLAIAASPKPCHGEYPKQPFLRGRPIDFALAAFIVLSAALVRLVRAKKPWAGHRARPLAIGVGAAGVLLFLLANMRLGYTATTLAFVVAFAVGIVEQRLFFRATRAGQVNGFSLRPATPEDMVAPVLRFFGGPHVPEALEIVSAASYRESAFQPALFRVERRSLRIFFVIFVLLLMLAIFATAMIVFARGT